MSDTKNVGGAQNVYFPQSNSPKWHFRRWSDVSALACDPALTPDVTARDSATYATDDGIGFPEEGEAICPWCDYSRRVYLEPGLSNPPSETWAFESVDAGGAKVWLPFEINGTSSFRPPKGARVLRATDPEVQAPLAPPKPAVPAKRWCDGDLTQVSRRVSAASKAAIDAWFIARADHVAAAERMRVFLQSRIGVTTDTLVQGLDELQRAQMAEAHAMLATQAAHDELVALIRKADEDKSAKLEHLESWLNIAYIGASLVPGADGGGR
jgi:hypothetical protein